MKSTSRPSKKVKAEAEPSLSPPPPNQAQEATAREGVFTEQERKQALNQLPSLVPTPDLDGSYKSSAGRRVVDAEALPPPAPPPPMTVAAVGEGLVDRGLPVPEHYGLDRLVALARDPYWLFVYWELKGGMLERLRFQYTSEVVDQARWALRVEAVPFSHRPIVDIDLKAGHWYLRVLPEGCYRVDLGYFNPDGAFETLCRSAEVHTPRNAPSSVLDERWGVAKDDLERLLRAGGAVLKGEAAPANAESGAAFRRMDPPRAAAFFSGRWSGMPLPGAKGTEREEKH